ncbi:type II toxin-antitoxin system HicB family antitoxin [Burkholderia sp. 22PA0099]|uniref:type II toxin-antitoxin system HicB family antitoxin n=1 Tax=Burkholderia sp. 22PA0099 TaxID=3237372 RepID=UPI0039C01ECA
MDYPIYITRRGPFRYRGTLADFPEAVAEGNAYAALPDQVVLRAIALYHRGPRLVPPPTTDMAVLQASSLDTGDGIWRFVEIEPGRILSSSVHIGVCLPERVVQDIDRAARALHVSRDEIVASACLHVTTQSVRLVVSDGAESMTQ